MDRSKVEWISGDCITEMGNMLSASVDLVVTSPPYNMGKEYEERTTEKEYISWTGRVAEAIHRVLKEGGSLCYQVGNFISKGEEVPIECLVLEEFRKRGFLIKNRVIWRVPHGLNPTSRLSGRHESLLWFTKGTGKYTFNIDEVRLPAEYPSKRNAKTGRISGHPLGKNPSNVWDLILTEWEESMFEVCNVKNGHPEKTTHPAQYPIELAERCILLLSKEGDIVLDPFAGTGTTALAALFHGRSAVCIEKNDAYHSMFSERQNSMNEACKTSAKLPYKPIAEIARVYNDKRKNLTDDQIEIWRDAIKKRKRIVETEHERDVRMK